MQEKTLSTYPLELLTRIKALREQGFGNRVITREVGIPRHTVCVLLRKLGYDAKQFTPDKRGRRAFPPETIDLVLCRRKEGISNREIAAEAGMTEKSATQILRRHGFRADGDPPQLRGRFLYPQEAAESVLSLRAEGHGSHVVARRTGLSRDTVKRLFRRGGFARQGCSGRRTGEGSEGGSGNGSKFVQVDAGISYLNPSPEMAWCLGLIYGDGHLSNVGQQVTIVTSDHDIAKKFAKIHGSPRVIRTGNYSRVTWTCARLYRELESYGLCPNKSARLQFPKLHPSVLPHFVRGLIDSDGSFYRKGSGNLSHLLAFCYACICEPFMRDLRDTMVEHAGVSASLKVKSRVQRDTPNRVWFIKYSHGNAARLGHWIYGPSSENLRGERKHAIWTAYKDRVLR